MRRLWDAGCHLVQVGVRSVSREEHEFIKAEERVTTYFAHELHDRWADVLAHLRYLEGDIYLSLDVDGLDPSVIPSTGTPQPDGLTWRQAIEVIGAVAAGPRRNLVGADVVEFVPSPRPPGCDLMVAKLALKILAFRFGASFRRPIQD
jgi:agmatinase